jgi:hypothetical protein
MAKIKNNTKTNDIIVKNIYKKSSPDKNIQEIIMKSYKFFIEKEWKEAK